MTPITTTKDLAKAVAALRKSAVVTVDTEFMRESTFWPILCLIQLASNDHETLIDALAPDLDLAPFFDLMTDEKVLKVFHAARQDVEIIHHLSGKVPHPIFDTQVAAMVCGYGDSISYDALVRKTTGGDIDKSHRFTDWSRRPLNDKQLDYALADVTYLRDVYRVLDAALRKNNRSHWLQEEMEVLTSPATYESHPEDAWRRLKMKVRKPKQIAALIEIAAWREMEAQRRDLPRSRVMKDDGVYEMATQLPRTREALAQLRAVSAGFARSSQGKDALAAIERALARDPKSLPVIDRREPMPSGLAPTVELLKVLLKKVCEDEGVAQRIVATVDDIEQIAARDDADVPALRGWRRELFGDMALSLKRGELALAIEKGRVVTFAAPKTKSRMAKAEAG